MSLTGISPRDEEIDPLLCQIIEICKSKGFEFYSVVRPPDGMFWSRYYGDFKIIDPPTTPLEIPVAHHQRTHLKQGTQTDAKT